VKKLNEVVDVLKDIFGDDVRVNENHIVGTPMYIEFTEDREPNIVQFFAAAENQRTRRSDARMTVFMADPKYGVPMAVISIDDLLEMFAALKEKVFEDELDDFAEELAESIEEKEEPAPVTARKLPVPPPPPVDSDQIPAETPTIPPPVEVPDNVMTAMADNISEPAAEEGVEDAE
jgi:hypothetical protein